MMTHKMIEEVKDQIDGLEMDPNKRILIQGLLTNIRSELLVYERERREAQVRQNVYAEICEKMLNRILDRNWDNE